MRQLPPPPYIGLGQREAQVNHELLFNHGQQRSLFFSFSRGNVRLAAMNDTNAACAEDTDQLAQALTASLVCRVRSMEGRKGCWTVPWEDSLQ